MATSPSVIALLVLVESSSLALDGAAAGTTLEAGEESPKTAACIPTTTSTVGLAVAMISAVKEVIPSHAHILRNTTIVSEAQCSYLTQLF